MKIFSPLSLGGIALIAIASAQPTATPPAPQTAQAGARGARPPNNPAVDAVYKLGPD